MYAPPQPDADWRTAPPIPMDPRGPINDAESKPFIDPAYLDAFEAGHFGVALPLEFVLEQAARDVPDLAAVLGFKFTVP